MTGQVGLWIDHRKAVIVTITEPDHKIRVIESKAERQPRRSGDMPLNGPFDSLHIPADDISHRAYMGHLNTYYDEVIDHIRDAQSILIFGPGEAKGELKKRLEKKNLDRRIAGIETSDKMTDNQIAAKVRTHFQKVVQP
jgi:hypothetical protein